MTVSPSHEAKAAEPWKAPDHGPHCRCLYHASLAESNEFLRQYAADAGEREDERRWEQDETDAR